MGMTSRAVLTEAGCFTRGCTVTLYDEPFPEGVRVEHCDATGARSTVTLEHHSVFKVTRNRWTGELMNTWVPEFVQWAHEFHEVADKMVALAVMSVPRR